MKEHRKGAHTVYDIKYHVVWVTKYRYKILQGEIALRARDVIREICEQREIIIIQGHVSQDHIHLLVSVPPHLSVSEVMQYIKGKSSRKLQQEYPSLRKRYWGQHLWARGYYCVSSGTVTDEMIKAYIENHSELPGDTFRVDDEAQ